MRWSNPCAVGAGSDRPEVAIDLLRGHPSFRRASAEIKPGYMASEGKAIGGEGSPFCRSGFRGSWPAVIQRQSLQTDHQERAIFDVATLEKTSAPRNQLTGFAIIQRDDAWPQNPPAGRTPMNAKILRLISALALG